jgi:hypothetical protein
MAIAAAISAMALMMVGTTGSVSSHPAASAFATVATAEAAPAKSASGGSGGGGANGAGQRFGTWLSDNAVPVLIAFAGCALVTVLFSRNIGAGVGIVLVTLMSLMFLLAPQSIAAFARGVAGIIF